VYLVPRLTLDANMLSIIAQAYVLDSSVKVAEMLASEGKRLGVGLELASFARWER